MSLVQFGGAMEMQKAIKTVKNEISPQNRGNGGSKVDPSTASTVFKLI